MIAHTWAERITVGGKAVTLYRGTLILDVPGCTPLDDHGFVIGEHTPDETGHCISCERIKSLARILTGNV